MFPWESYKIILKWMVPVTYFLHPQGGADHILKNHKNDGWRLKVDTTLQFTITSFFYLFICILNNLFYYHFSIYSMDLETR